MRRSPCSPRKANLWRTICAVPVLIPTESASSTLVWTWQNTVRSRAPLANGFTSSLQARHQTPVNSRRAGSRLLVEVARLCPEIDVTLLWRPWGDQHAAQRAFANLDPPQNIRMDTRRVDDMASVYHEADAVACLYEPGFGKSCPNSIIEALACGVPALVSATCGIGGLVSREGAGIATTRNPADVAEAARTLRREHTRFAAAARRVAEKNFDVRQFVDAYARLYDATAEAMRQPVSVRPQPVVPRESRVAGAGRDREKSNLPEFASPRRSPLCSSARDRPGSRFRSRVTFVYDASLK